MLSRVDIEVLALAYEIECERNGGDWRLRSVPGQKRVNGRPPVKEEDKKEETESAAEEKSAVEESVDGATEAAVTDAAEEPKKDETPSAEEVEAAAESAMLESPAGDDTPEEIEDEVEEEDDAADDDDGEWITPTNYKKRLARDESGTSGGSEPKTMQVATMTTDFAVRRDLFACLIDHFD